MPDECKGASGRVAGQSGPTVLLIDDDPAVLDSLSLRLEGYGFRVLTAPDGVRGLDAFREHVPAAVVTDILMPEQDGIGAILEMRRTRSDVKIIAMSGGGKFDKADYLTIAEKLGADAAFEKTDIDKLLTMLTALLKRG